MGLALQLALRSLLARPGRTFFASLGIAVGIATVVAIFTLDHNTILGLSQPNSDDWQADIEVSAPADIEDPRSDLAGLPGVAGVSAFFQNEVRISRDAGPDTPSLLTRFYAFEISKAEALGIYRVEKGKDLESDSRGQILIGAGLAEDFGVEPGDQVTLSRPPRSARKICIDGRMSIVEPDEPLPPRSATFRVAGVVARERLGARSRGRLVIAPYAEGRDLFEGVNIGETFVLKRDPGVDIERLKQSLGEAYSPEINQQILIGQAADERAFRNGVRFAGLLAMVLGLFVIFHTLSIALVERVREISTLHALGTTRRQIAGIFFLEALILAVVGGAMGLGLGLGLAKLLLRARITTLGVGKVINVFEVPWNLVIPLMATGCLMALLGSTYPILRVRKSSTAAGLRTDEAFRSEGGSRGFRFFSALLIAFALPALYLLVVPVIGEFDEAFAITLFVGTGLLSLLIGLPLLVPEVLARAGLWLSKPLLRLFPCSGLLAGRTLLQAPTRLAVGIVGIAMVATAFVVLKSMTNSLRAEVEVWSDEALVDKVFVTNMGPVDYEAFKKKALAHPDIVAVEHGGMRTYAPFLITGIPADAIRDYGPLQNEEILDRFRRERGIIISGRLATDQELSVGDEIPIRTGRGVVERFPVVAVSDAYGYVPHPDERIYGVIAASVMLNDFCISPKKIGRAGLRMRPGVKDPRRVTQELKGQLAEDFPGATNWRYETGAFVLNFFLVDIDRDFLIFDIILALSAILAAMGLLNAQLLSTLERKKDFGILRALGADGRQIAGATIIEASITGILGGLLGVLLGLMLSPMVIGALELVSGLPLPTRSAGSFVLWVLLGAWFVAVSSVLYPIYRAHRLDPVAAVRTG